MTEKLIGQANEEGGRMITDEERRNVAANIRSAAERAKDDLNDDSIYSKIAVAYVVSCGIRGVPRYEDLLHLADLIDRPTCKMVREGEGFRCSACGTFHDMSGFEEFPWPYCLDCGAEVVSSDAAR